MNGGINNLWKFDGIFEEYANRLEETRVVSPNYISSQDVLEENLKAKKTLRDKLISYSKSYGPLVAVGLIGSIFLGMPDAVVGTNSFGVYSYTMLTLGFAFALVPLGFSYVYEWILNGLSKIPKKIEAPKNLNFREIFKKKIDFKSLESLKAFKNSLLDQTKNSIPYSLVQLNLDEFVISLGRNSRDKKRRINEAVQKAIKEKDGRFIQRWIVLFPLLQQVAAILSFPFWERLISLYYRVQKRPYINHFRNKGYSIKEVEGIVKKTEGLENSYLNQSKVIKKIQQNLNLHKERRIWLESIINHLIFSLNGGDRYTTSSYLKKINRKDVREVIQRMKEDSSFSKQIIWTKVRLNFEIDELLSQNKSEDELRKEVAMRIYSYTQEYKNLLTDKNRIQILIDKAPLETKKVLRKILNKVVSKPKEVHNFLMNNTTPFHAKRSGMEYLTDQLALVLLTVYVAERSNYGGIFDSGITQIYPHSLSGTSPQGFADTLNNSSLHLFFASMLMSLSLRPDTSIQKLQEEVNDHYSRKSQIGKKEGWLEHIMNRLTYVTKWGVEENIGELAIKREKAMYFSAWQSVFIFFIIPRMLSGELSFLESTASFLIFSGYSLPVYRWFWAWVSGSAKYDQARIRQNKELINKISTHLERIERGAWLEGERDIMNSIHQIENHVESLYGKNSSITRQIKKLPNDIRSIDQELKNPKKLKLFLMNLENRKYIVSSIKEVLEQKPPSTEVHSGMDWAMTTFLGPIVTTILAIPLLVWTFNPDFLTISNSLSALAIYAGSIGLFVLATKSFIKDIPRLDGSINKSWKNTLFEKGGVLATSNSKISEDKKSVTRPSILRTQLKNLATNTSNKIGVISSKVMTPVTHLKSGLIRIPAFMTQLKNKLTFSKKENASKIAESTDTKNNPKISEDKKSVTRLSILRTQLKNLVTNTSNKIGVISSKVMTPVTHLKSGLIRIPAFMTQLKNKLTFSKKENASKIAESTDTKNNPKISEDKKSVTRLSILRTQLKNLVTNTSNKIGVIFSKVMTPVTHLKSGLIRIPAFMTQLKNKLTFSKKENASKIAESTDTKNNPKISEDKKSVTRPSILRTQLKNLATNTSNKIGVISSKVMTPVTHLKSGLIRIPAFMTQLKNKLTFSKKENASKIAESTDTKNNSNIEEKKSNPGVQESSAVESENKTQESSAVESENKTQKSSAVESENKTQKSLTQDKKIADSSLESESSKDHIRLRLSHFFKFVGKNNSRVGDLLSLVGEKFQKDYSRKYSASSEAQENTLSQEELNKESLPASENESSLSEEKVQEKKSTTPDSNQKSCNKVMDDLGK